LRSAPAGPEAETGAVPLAAVDPTRAAWRDLRRRLRHWLFGARVNPWLLTVAAASLLVSVGLGVRLVGVEERLAAAGRAAPVVNLPTLSLTTGRRGAEADTVRVAPGQPFYVSVTPELRCDAYRAEVSAAAADGGAGTVTLDGLRRDERGSLNALLYRPPGRYTLRLFGCQPESRLSAQDFRVEAAAAPPPPDDGGHGR
jgi:hypothetical protein